MNSPSTSPMTVVRNYLHMCAVYSSRGYYLRTAFISLRASDSAATIRRNTVLVNPTS